jgi:hypothetical protein
VSDWTHNICSKCWQGKHPHRTPTAMVNASHEICCFCGQANQDGIFMRHDPKDPKLTCHGYHEPEMIVG